jgi:hypothetical protein
MLAGYVPVAPDDCGQSFSTILDDSEQSLRAREAEAMVGN